MYANKPYSVTLLISTTLFLVVKYWYLATRTRLCYPIPVCTHYFIQKEKKRPKKIKNKNEVSARPMTTAILLLRYPEGQPYCAYARNLHHRHRFDKESPVFAIYTQQVQLLEFESRRIKKVKRHFREIRPGKTCFPGSKDYSRY